MSTNDAGKHTPTPWRTRKIGVAHNGEKIFDIESIPGPTNVAEFVYEDDAALIVRAVNSHADLVAALENLADFAETEARGFGDECPSRITKLTNEEFAEQMAIAIQSARAALAKAKAAV